MITIKSKITITSTARNEKSLLNFLGSSRDKSGDGSSPCSLSRASVRRPARRGRRLPDAILHGKRSLRPRSRAVQRFTTTGFRVRLLGPLGLVVAPPACEPGQDTSQNSFPRLHRLAPGQPLFFDSAFARCHGSRLFTLRLLFVLRPAVPFLTSPAFRKVFTGPAETPCPSRSERSLCPAFRRLSFG
jgi:hypothetical protein